MTAGAGSRGWGDPSAAGYRKNHIVKISAGGRDLWVRREVAHLFKGFVDEIVAGGYRIDLGAIDDWGYVLRPVRGYEDEYAATGDLKYLSNHSWGLAIDLNARTNPMTNRLVTDMPKWVIDAAKRWGLLWGGHYSGVRKDPMHFEFIGRPEDVARYPLQLDEEDLTIMDAATRAYLDERFDAVDARLDKVENDTGILRNALKGLNSTGGKSALWLKLEAGFGAVVDAVKAGKG